MIRKQRKKSSEQLFSGSRCLAHAGDQRRTARLISADRNATSTGDLCFCVNSVVKVRRNHKTLLRAHNLTCTSLEASCLLNTDHKYWGGFHWTQTDLSPIKQLWDVVELEIYIMDV